MENLKKLKFFISGLAKFVNYKTKRHALYEVSKISFGVSF